MNKRTISIITILFTLIFNACEDPLEKGPLGIISEPLVWDNESLVDLNVANLYARCEFYPGTESKSQGDIGKLVMNSCAAGYCRTFGGWPNGYKFTQGLFSNQGTGANDVMEYWKWDLVRDINLALSELENKKGKFSEDYIEKRIGELHFLRAWAYFQMVMRYGGIPLITEVQATGVPAEQLSVPRSKEEEIYEFIHQELVKSYEALAGKTQEYGRITEWAALALQSRANMYAGSVGTFGTMQMDGLLGVSDPQKFWKRSYDASKKIIGEGPFELYGFGSDNPEQDYYDLFTRAERNSETILGEIFVGEGSKAENWERWCAPAVVDGTTFFNTYLETFEMYEYIDGTPGTLDRSTLVEGVFHDMNDFIGKKDPRCRANIFLPECTYGGATVWMHEGLYVNGELKTANQDGIEVPAKGPARDIQRTGMFNKKRSNEDFQVHSAFDLGGTDYMIFRLGEIYLNLAEAALALNKQTEAKDALNMNRRRVGMPDKQVATWENIQAERGVELCFENQRYWDLRRWRIAEEKIASRNRTYTGVKWRKDYDHPGMYEVILVTTGAATDSWERIFDAHHYYFPISLERIQNSPALLENPGYE